MTSLMPLWRIERELEILLDSMDMCPTDELRTELEMRISEYMSAEASKIDHVGWVFTSLDNVVESAKREAERLRLRQQVAERTAARLEQYVLSVLRRRDGRPLKGNVTTLSLRHSEVLIIDNPDAVPTEWKRSTLSVDIPRDPIKKALRAGESVPGVHIERKDHLQRK
jgi:hypothetical protein